MLSRFFIICLAAPSFAAEKITYDDHIFPLFESKCLNCHNPDKKKGDLDLSTYTGTMAGSSGGKIALAGDGGSSKLFTLSAQTAEPFMPPEGEKIAKKDADLIRSWIDGGLLENKGSKAKKKAKPAFDLSTVSGGKKPEGPAAMPADLLLEPVVTPRRSTVIADIESSPWAPLVAITGQRQILLFHSDSLELLGVLPFPVGQPETISFHPSGKYLIAGGGIAGKSGKTITWDITSGKVIMEVGREFDSVLAADLRADLAGVALGGPSRLVKLWDTEELEEFKSIKKHTDWITALAYSHDGVLLATGDRNNGIQIWESSTGNEFHSLRGHQKAIVDLKWRADSNLVASASEDGTLRYWDMNQGKEIKKADAGGGGAIAMDYARTGQLVTASRDRRVKIWKPDLTMERQTNPFGDLVTEVEFTHDAARFITATWDGKIEVWNTIDLKKVGEINPNPPSIKDRLVALSKALDDHQELLAAAKGAIEKTDSELQSAKDQLAEIEQKKATSILENKRVTKQISSLEDEVKKLLVEAKTMMEQRSLIAKESPDPNKLRIELLEQRRRLALTQQTLSSELATAQAGLIKATREVKKAEENKVGKEALEKAREEEKIQKAKVKLIGKKLEEHKSTLAAHQTKLKNLDEGKVAEDSRLQEIEEDRQKTLARSEEMKKAIASKRQSLTNSQAKVTELGKGIPNLKTAIAEKEKAVAQKKKELQGLIDSGSHLPQQIKKWKAAQINTEVHDARNQLEELNSQGEEVKPELIAAQKEIVQQLTKKYEEAKQ